MKIDAIDIYWVRIPLAFVWKTSYADQRDTDTILVRMEGSGHHAWGESCPPFIPSYSSEHTGAVFHTVREHMAPRIVGQDIESDLAGGITRHHEQSDEQTERSQPHRSPKLQMLRPCL